MTHDALLPRVLKVWGIQAARISDTAPLITRLRENGPLAVILSAPNTDEFRTTNVLISAAQALTAGDIAQSRNHLLSVQDFILNTVCEPLHGDAIFGEIRRDVVELFQTYFAHMEVYARDRSSTARFYTSAPGESNDFVASVWKKPTSNRWWAGRISIVIPFIELGENISAIIYAHITGGVSVMSRSWMREQSDIVMSRVRESHNLIISGALRMDARDKMLLRFWRWYTDANAGRLAVGAGAELLVHKEFPVCTADPRIVNGSSRPIQEASMETLRATLHPLVGAQFLNRYVFASGEPIDIKVGDFASERITRVSRGDRAETLPLIQKGPRVQRHTSGVIFWDILLSPQAAWPECLVSVLDHSPRSSRRIEEIAKILWKNYILGLLNNRVASVLVSHHQADDIVRQLHEKFCE